MADPLNEVRCRLIRQRLGLHQLARLVVVVDAGVRRDAESVESLLLGTNESLQDLTAALASW